MRHYFMLIIAIKRTFKLLIIVIVTVDNINFTSYWYVTIKPKVSQFKAAIRDHGFIIVKINSFKGC